MRARVRLCLIRLWGRRVFGFLKSFEKNGGGKNQQPSLKPLVRHDLAQKHERRYRRHIPQPQPQEVTAGAGLGAKSSAGQWEEAWAGKHRMSEPHTLQREGKLDYFCQKVGTSPRRRFETSLFSLSPTQPPPRPPPFLGAQEVVHAGDGGVSATVPPSDSRAKHVRWPAPLL